MNAVILDLSRTLLFPKDGEYGGELNPLHRELSAKNPNYGFWEHFKLNFELLGYLKKLKGKTKLCIFTSGRIQEAPELKKSLSEVFDLVLSAEDLGVKKSDLGAYSKVCQILHVLPEDAILIDDSPRNVSAAREAGLEGVLFENSEKTIKFLREKLERL